MTRLFRLVVISGIAAGGLAFAALGAAPDAQPAPRTIRVGVLSRLAWTIPQGKGWFEQEGLRVELTEVRNFMQLPTLLAAGQADIVELYLAANFWNMVLEGADFKILSGSTMATAAQGGEPARNVRGYVVRKDLHDSGVIKSVKDLEGRKMADFAPLPPRGQISPFPIGHKVFGDSFRRIDWLRIANEDDILKALERKDIDGARMRTRWVKLAVKRGIAVELVKETDYVPKIQVLALVTRQSFLKDQRDTAVRFVRVFLRMQQYARAVQRGQHTEEYLGFVKKFSDIPPDLASDLIQEVAFTDELAVDDLMDTQRHFVMVKSQQRIVPLESVVDPGILAEAKQTLR